MPSTKRHNVMFSHLALGARFVYLATLGPEQIYVKISNDRKGSCVAAWNPKLAEWAGQGVYCLNDTGNDIEVKFVE
jgi:hypothetical protein